MCCSCLATTTHLHSHCFSTIQEIFHIRIKKGSFAPFFNTNFILCALCFILSSILYYLYSKITLTAPSNSPS